MRASFLCTVHGLPLYYFLCLALWPFRLSLDRAARNFLAKLKLIWAPAAITRNEVPNSTLKKILSSIWTEPISLSELLIIEEEYRPKLSQGSLGVSRSQATNRKNIIFACSKLVQEVPEIEHIMVIRYSMSNNHHLIRGRQADTQERLCSIHNYEVYSWRIWT